MTLCVFDVLYAGGRNVMALPLEERKAIMRQLLAPLGRRIAVVGDFPAEAALFDHAVVVARLDGFVAKRRGSVYVPGVRTRDWLKIRRVGWQEGRSWRK